MCSSVYFCANSCPNRAVPRSAGEGKGQLPREQILVFTIIICIFYEISQGNHTKLTITCKTSLMYSQCLKFGFRRSKICPIPKQFCSDFRRYFLSEIRTRKSSGFWTVTVESFLWDNAHSRLSIEKFWKFKFNQLEILSFRKSLKSGQV